MRSPMEMVSDAIVDGIRLGQFAPGQHLVEADLTRRLGTSRGTFREALQHLAANGIVSINRHRGAYISEIGHQAFSDLLSVMDPLSRLAARLAAQAGANPSQRTRLKRIIAAMATYPTSGNSAEFFESRFQFYQTLLEIGGNKELARVMPITRVELFRVPYEKMHTIVQRRQTVKGYTAVAAAVMAGNPKQAEHAMMRQNQRAQKILAASRVAVATTGQT